MGLLHKLWQVTWVFVSLFLSSSLVESSHTYDHESLDAFLREHANKQKFKPGTGVFYNISLPANFTGMKVSVVRLHTASFWLRGLNFSFLDLPPRIVPQPNRKRMAILYENLGNWSSLYYNVPNYTMVAPVLGFMAFSSLGRTLISSEKMNFTIQEDPITIRFPQVGPQTKSKTPICAQFGAGGSVGFNNMIEPYVCVAQSQGHYTLVVPLPSRKAQSQSQSKRFPIWWVLGFVIGFVGLVILALVLAAIVKLAKRMRIRKMERNSEGGEPFDTFWIGGTKLPSASVIRTQPVLENDEVIPSSY